MERQADLVIFAFIQPYPAHNKDKKSRLRSKNTRLKTGQGAGLTSQGNITLQIFNEAKKTGVCQD